MDIIRAIEQQDPALQDIKQHVRDTAEVLLRVTRGGMAMQSAGGSAVLEL